MVNPHTQFIRKASLVVGDGSNGLDLSELQFKFSVKMAELTHPQYATFRIYNVSNTTLDALKVMKYNNIIFQAGYQNGNYGLIFIGKVIQGR